MPATPAATLTKARRIALDNGVRYTYTGNVRDEAGQSTYYHQCGRLVIGRDGYRITAWALDEAGACRACGAACAGTFAERPGDWGERRQPVRLREFAGEPG